VLLAAGCGGGEEQPSLAQPLAEALASRAESAAGHLDLDEFCAARTDAVVLQQQLISAINDGAVPAELQEELLGSVNALTEAISCTPPGADAGAAEDAGELADRLRERSD
jgi:hypothetical protein